MPAQSRSRRAVTVVARTTRAEYSLPSLPLTHETFGNDVRAYTLNPFARTKGIKPESQGDHSRVRSRAEVYAAPILQTKIRLTAELQTKEDSG